MTKPRYRLTVEVQAALKRALDQAAKGRAPREIGPDVYLVPSAHGDWSYEVRVESLPQMRANCTCRHAVTPEAKGICFHKVAAMLAAARKERVSPKRPAMAPGGVDAKMRVLAAFR